MTMSFFGGRGPSFSNNTRCSSECFLNKLTEMRALRNSGSTLSVPDAPPAPPSFSSVDTPPRKASRLANVLPSDIEITEPENADNDDGSLHFRGFSQNAPSAYQQGTTPVGASGCVTSGCVYEAASEMAGIEAGDVEGSGRSTNYNEGSVAGLCRSEMWHEIVAKPVADYNGQG